MTGLHPECFDIVIVGAGPAGLSAALEAKAQNLSYVVLETENIAQTIRNYPKGKAFFNKPGEQITFFENEKIVSPNRENVLEHWEKTIEQHSLHIHVFEKVIDFVGDSEKCFTINTDQDSYLTKNIVLAFGNMGQPRFLGIPGENLPHVFHCLKDPAIFSSKKCLVVGGGDSAAEAALALSKNNAEVAISYRKSEFTRLKENNLEALKNSEIKVFFETNPILFKAGVTHLKYNQGMEEIYENDYVFVLCGTVFPSSFFEKVGIHLNEKNEAIYNEETLETNFKNIYLAGSLTKEKLIPTAISQGKKVIKNIINSRQA